MNPDRAHPTFARCLPRRRAVALVVAAVASTAGVRAATAQSATPPAPGCSPATPAAGGGTPTAGADCLSVGLFDIYFSPNLLTIPADTPVTVLLRNDGAAPHNFSVTDHRNPGVKNLGIVVDVAPGETKTTTIEAPAGTYYFFCDVPGHEQAGMVGYLTAEAGAAVATTTATVTPPAGA